MSIALAEFRNTLDSWPSGCGVFICICASAERQNVNPSNVCAFVSMIAIFVGLPVLVIWLKRGEGGYEFSEGLSCRYEYIYNRSLV